MSDDRQYAPATLRNRDSILDVLRDVQRRESSLRSQAARASTSFIVREISRASFSNLPILIPMHG